MPHDMSLFSQKITLILHRLESLENINAVRKCLTRYMTICDQLDSQSPLQELANLFTKNAIWEGVGEKYQKSLGRYIGRSAIHTMFQNYVLGEPHFAMNAHFLTSENINIDETGVEANGTWLMLQTSTFHDGKAHLNSARLTIQFSKHEDQWLMSHFQTENIFSRPISHWHSEDDLPVPNQ